VSSRVAPRRSARALGACGVSIAVLCSGCVQSPPSPLPSAATSATPGYQSVGPTGTAARSGVWEQLELGDDAAACSVTAAAAMTGAWAAACWDGTALATRFLNATTNAPSVVGLSATGIAAGGAGRIAAVAALAARADGSVLAAGTVGPDDFSAGDAAAWVGTPTTSWTRIDAGAQFADAAIESVAVGSLIVAVGRHGFRIGPGVERPVSGAVWTSRDGASWAGDPPAEGFAKHELDGILNTTGGWLTWGHGQVPGSNRVWTSGDGMSWRQISAFDPAWGPVNAGAVSDSATILVGSFSLEGGPAPPGIWRSEGGAETWQRMVVPRDPTLGATLYGVASIGHEFLAVGVLGTPRETESWRGAAWRSVDGGLTWRELATHPLLDNAVLRFVVALPDRFVIFGSIEDPTTTESQQAVWTLSATTP
jgi:hypothetical protein